MSVRLAVIGDVHLHFNEKDVAYFNASNYDLILFVGDLVNYAPWRAKVVWNLINQLNKPTFFMPGNHDSTNVVQLIAEVLGNQLLAKLSGLGQTKNFTSLSHHLTSTSICGYSLHPQSINDYSFDIIAARPHSMGGPNLSFKPYLKKAFGIHSIEESTAKINEQIDKSQNKNIIFFAHNGPSGLGTKRDDIWGCDFKKSEGDFGDPDLEQAIAYARSQDKNVLAVIAGHMHQGLKGGGERRWVVERNGTTYLNAARVPRIYETSDTTVHHHVCVEVESSAIKVTAQEISL
ncbi:MAG: hypothetical protein HOI23_02440 [Deltaproteobacteria bacterium]|jgi:uncharacterized protein (TIGR04168 family)|nr:hypothetical protein [Deltaproteobacteria bacterium]MBT6431619.1 hypothetical protein [Deltaproteobacteria bacterium]MBT6490066.1 hypothetical protein [Deltaproteobacteria bacterium]